jgi:ABC-type dipeptide/oligopeptide/nickel transport system ATPase subunit
LTASEVPLFAARDVNVVFGRGVAAFTAVQDVSLTIGRGDLVGIVGESGSGKTTMARVVAGLQKPTGGQLEHAGAVPRQSRFGRTHRRTDIQMVFQDPYSSLNPRQTAASAVAEAFRVRQSLSRSQAMTAALELLQSIGIGPTMASRLPDLLSGGQRQRVSVARALAAEPSLLIADEPTSALDQSAQAQLLNLLRRIQADRRLSILFISHDLGIIRYFTDRVYVLRQGRVVESGDTEQVFAHPSDDYTRMLIDSIPGGRRSPRSEVPASVPAEHDPSMEQVGRRGVVAAPAREPAGP